MEHKGYIGQFTFDEKQELFHGKVSNIKDLITFQGKSIEKIRHAFKDAINEYIDWCKKNGKDPEKPSLKIDSAHPLPLHGS
jgi:predicted HicB family RNase H-like nuclease